MRTEDSAEDAAARREVVRAVERAVDELPTAFRAVFMLREVEDLDTAETAEVLGIPEATVKTRLHRARGLVRDALTRRAGGAVRDAFGFGSGRCDAIVARVLARLRERTTGPADAGQEGDY